MDPEDQRTDLADALLRWGTPGASPSPRPNPYLAWALMNWRRPGAGDSSAPPAAIDPDAGRLAQTSAATQPDGDVDLGSNPLREPQPGAPALVPAASLRLLQPDARSMLQSPQQPLDQPWRPDLSARTIASSRSAPPGGSQVGAPHPGRLVFKPGAAAPSPEVADMLQCTADRLGGALRVTATSNGRHSGPHDPHYQGKAADVTTDDPAATMRAAANCGAVYQQNEYVNPSPDSNAPHVHLQTRPGRGGARGPYFPDPGPAPRPD